MIITDEQKLVKKYLGADVSRLTDAVGGDIILAPLIFSEVMRDADLVVSVAQTAEEALTWQETFTRRAELLSALVEELGLPGVTVERRLP